MGGKLTEVSSEYIVEAYSQALVEIGPSALI
jgi:hypothetical protein